MATERVYLTAVPASDIGEALVDHFQSKGYQTQTFDTNGGQSVVQIRKENFLRDVLGMAYALSIVVGQGATATSRFAWSGARWLLRQVTRAKLRTETRTGPARRHQPDRPQPSESSAVTSASIAGTTLSSSCLFKYQWKACNSTGLGESGPSYKQIGFSNHTNADAHGKLAAVKVNAGKPRLAERIAV